MALAIGDMPRFATVCCSCVPQNRHLAWVAAAARRSAAAVEVGALKTAVSIDMVAFVVDEESGRTGRNALGGDPEPPDAAPATPRQSCPNRKGLSPRTRP